MKEITTGNRQLEERIDEIFGESAKADFVRRALLLASGSREGIAPRTENVIRLMLDQRADHVVIGALLLEPLVRSGELNRAEVARRFCEATARLIADVTEHTVLRTDTAANQRGDLVALLESLTRDVRSAIMRIGLRLEDLEFQQRHSGGSMESLARETLDLYVPLAGRLGLGSVRSRLEDACFRILEPEAHSRVEQAISPIREEDARCLPILMDGIRSLMRRNRIDAQVQGRAKGLYSLHSKMVRAGLPLEEIADKIGLRVVVNSVPECYSALGLLHTHFQPIPGRFRDYIGLPKANGYQSLHTTVYPIREISHKPVEIQIRTHAMHAEAEFGAAAHWLYKTSEEARVEHERQLSWLRGLHEEHSQSSSHQNFVERLKELVYGDHIVVFDGTGQRVSIPSGSRVADFARATGMALTDEAAVSINGVPRSPDSELGDGDTVTLVLPGAPPG